MIQAEFPMSREEMKEYQLELIQKLVEENGGLCRTSEILAFGIDYRRIQQFMEEGQIVKVKNGYFTTKRSDYSEEELITSMFPDGVLTMESALFYHGYLSLRPFQWQIAISKNTSKSRFKLNYPVVTPFYTEPEVLSMGVTEVLVGEKPMKIYTIDRLICDVLKYEEKMDRVDFRKAAFSYINDENKDVSKLMLYARERKVLKKVQGMIGVWL